METWSDSNLTNLVYILQQLKNRFVMLIFKSDEDDALIFQRVIYILQAAEYILSKRSGQIGRAEHVKIANLLAGGTKGRINIGSMTHQFNPDQSELEDLTVNYQAEFDPSLDPPKATNINRVILSTYIKEILQVRIEHQIDTVSNTIILGQLRILLGLLKIVTCLLSSRDPNLSTIKSEIYQLNLQLNMFHITIHI